MEQKLGWQARFLFAVIAAISVSGCTAMIEKQILNTAPVITGVGDLKAEYAKNRFSYCTQKVADTQQLRLQSSDREPADPRPESAGLKNTRSEHTGNEHTRNENPQHCVTYYDFAEFLLELDGEIKSIPKGSFEFTDANYREENYREENTEALNFKERMEFRFPDLSGNAPLVIVAPGYGLSATHMILPWASWFRSMGMHPIVLLGPTEAKPMQFGLNHTQAVATMLTEQYPNRDIVLFGFSMGALGALAIEAELLEKGMRPQALMLVAPMNNFREQALSAYHTMRANDWKVRWFVPESRFSKAVDRIILASNIHEEELLLKPKLINARTPMFVAAGEGDSLVKYGELRDILNLPGEQGGEAYQPYPGHPEFNVVIEPLANDESQFVSIPRFNHAAMFFLLRPLRTPLQEWLGTRVELTLAPETEYPEHNEEQAETLE
ncbi:hypothetical protein CWE08_00370 [Aliidiomarina iranensis]|uniref:Serine aminopeptidase S33 domain-containing protein n=1 Tax=Aliidiomarina iranensis TaxID=1434071 RepID=A0A432W1P0_9GAMM|nr:alpha/beta hydrolase [Aliidiomarina iranensis]RUO23144.1 hypothetical protein CWE08_00370 [Aliidiomarina iranensis]